MSAALFWTLAILATASGFMVFRVDSMARATFSLLVSFLAGGGLLVLLGLGYLGILVVLMMVMEMVVMAVFMIAYMMNPAGLMPMAMVHNKAGALAVSGGVFVALAAGIFLTDWPQEARAHPPDPTFQAGEALMGSYMLAMVVLGVVLFATMVAVVTLASQRGRYDRFGDDLDRRSPEDPMKGGLAR